MCIAPLCLLPRASRLRLLALLAALAVLPPGGTVQAQATPDSVIDVAVFYTEAVRGLFSTATSDGHEETRAQIDNMVAQANTAYAHSGVQLRLALVAAEEVAGYTVQNKVNALEYLRSPRDGILDGVHPIRERVWADIVVLLADIDGGIAYTMTPTTANAFANLAFAVTTPNAYVFIHELGHIMGMKHDRYTECSPDPPSKPNWDCGSAMAPDAHGYLNQRMFDQNAPRSARWYTVMAYPTQCKVSLGQFACGPVLLRFSNPNQNYRGAPMGVALTDSNKDSHAVDGPADAVRVLNEVTRHNVANFRVGRAVKASFDAAAYAVAEGGTGVTVTVRLHAAPGRPLEIPLKGTSTNGAEAGDYTIVPPRLSFDPDETEQTFEITAVDDTAQESEETVTLAFGPLPNGVTANRAAHATATVTLTDNEAPPPPPAQPMGLQARVGHGQVTLSWANPNDASITTYQVRQQAGGGPYGSWTAIPHSGASTTTTTIMNLTNGQEYTFQIRAVNAGGESQASAERKATPRSPPPPPPVTGGGGGGGTVSRDRHGNTPADATALRLRRTPPYASSTAGEINSRRDVDYFRLTAPHDGVLVVETTGSTDTVGTVWQADEELATARRGGTRRNFRLPVRVEAGEVVIAVAGNGGRTGEYRLETHLMVGYLGNPGAHSFQSGVGVISGWVCEAEDVTIEITPATGAVQHYAAGYGTERRDTAPYCGDTDNGFGLLFNWNRLGDGEHEVVAWVDEIELGRATVTVTTLGQEFVEDAVGTCAVEDFPRAGTSAFVAWQQSSQNFVIAAGRAPTVPTQAGIPGVGYLGNPAPNSYQSGVGVISGWVCEAEAVVIEITPEAGAVQRYAASYGTERLDTAAARDGTVLCGDTDNGFGLLFNWNRLGDGEHTVVALVDGEELGRAVVRVTTLGEEFAEDLAGTCVVEDFPGPGETVTLQWQQTSQNFVIVERAAADAGP